MNHTIDDCYSKHGYPPWYKHSTNIDKNCNQVIKGEKTQNFGNKENDTEKHPFTEDQMQKLL